MPSTKTKQRGAIPSPRHKLASAIPHVSLPSIPPNILYFPKQLSMWGNDHYGDCVTAEEAFAKACYNPEIFFTYDYIVQWATNNGYLNGAIISEVLQTMQTNGFSQNGNTYDDGPYNSVNWTNQTNLQSAISQGPVKIGVGATQLQNVIEENNDQSGWFAIGFSGGDTEDHCVSLCGYGTISWLAQQLNVTVPPNVDGNNPGYAMFTWDSIGIIDVPSLLNITFEAWLRTPTTIIIPTQNTK